MNELQIIHNKVLTFCNQKGMSDFNLAEMYRSAFPFVFIKQGIAMLSGVLKSPKAIRIKLSIMRIFVELRKYSLGYEALKHWINRPES
jgi:hypothetical protein